jgi:hypothetical protein
MTTFVRAGNGRQLAVKISGNPTGHPVRAPMSESAPAALSA